MLIPKTEVIVTKNGETCGRYVFEPGDYVIGREPGCEIIVDADLVSRRHAQLTVNYSEWLIEDLQSSNGTQVNGKPVTECVKVWPNQKIQVGSATIELRRVKEQPSGDHSMAPSAAALKRVLPEEFLRDKKYDIGGIVAQGGMGAILNAKEATTERTVAMKVMLNGNSEDDMLRFIGEAKVTAQLEHPNVVPLYELSVDEQEQPFYTMKFVKGVTLRSILEKIRDGDVETIKAYPLTLLLTIFQKVCDALAFAHSKGIVHRDLKPENVMIGDYGEVLVMDWGLAKVLGKADPNTMARSIVTTAAHDDANASHTMAGTIMGTPNFMAPEQAAGEVEKIDARTDIFSLGGILYNILTLRPPFTGRSVPEILEKVVEARVISPTAFNKKPLIETSDGKKIRPIHCPGGRIPEALSAVTMKALALKPLDRYQNVQSLQKDITAYQTGFATSAEKAGLTRQIGLLIKRHKAVFSTAITAWIVVTAVVIWFVVKVTHERSVANQALTDLRSQAPAFADMAETYIEQLNLPSALAKLDSALQLDPSQAKYHARRGDVLQTLLRFTESASAYEKANVMGFHSTRLDAAYALSLRLGASVPNGKEPTAKEFALLNALLIDQKRFAEAVAIAPRLANSQDVQRRTFAARLKQMQNTPQNDLTSVFKATADDRYDVDLGLLLGSHDHTLEALRGVPMRSLFDSRQVGADLSPLAGQRLESLVLDYGRFTSVRALHGMPLRSLSLHNTPLASLEGLEGCPLNYLNISFTQVKSLAPLKGAPLETLYAGYSDIEDLDPLKGMPLKTLAVDHTKIRSIEPLRGMRLRDLYIGFNVNVDTLEPLRGMPLETLTVAARRITELAPLAGMPLKRLVLDACNGLHSFARLRDLPLEYLNIRSTEAPDFDVLQHLKLKGLNACNTNFADGNVLSGQPIDVLLLSRCPQLKDVTFLKDLPTLKALALPPNLIQAARDLPGLRYLSIDDISGKGAPTLEDVARFMIPVEKFWTDFDAQQAAQKK